MKTAHYSRNFQNTKPGSYFTHKKSNLSILYNTQTDNFFQKRTMAVTLSKSTGINDHVALIEQALLVTRFPAAMSQVSKPNLTRLSQLLQLEAELAARRPIIRPSSWLFDNIVGSDIRTRSPSPSILSSGRFTPRDAENHPVLSTPTVEEPSCFDILCGRGGRSNHHPGNKKYREVVRIMKASYRNIDTKSAKTDVSRAIVEHVYNYGGRFLKQDKATGNYHVLSPVEARKKTSQALREAKDLKWTV